jgi:hypothetical protein
MYRTLIALCAASIIGSIPVAASAQSSRPNSQYDEKDSTITGCLQKNKSGGFWLTDAAVEAAGAKSKTAVPGTDRPTATTGDKDVQRATEKGLWNLKNGKDLDRYVNQKIQVTGRAKNDTSGDKLKGTTGHELDARDFDVKSVTKISDSCS